jgi:hypothetical protein
LETRPVLPVADDMGERPGKIRHMKPYLFSAITPFALIAAFALALLPAELVKSVLCWIFVDWMYPLRLA